MRSIPTPPIFAWMNGKRTMILVGVALAVAIVWLVAIRSSTAPAPPSPAVETGTRAAPPETGSNDGTAARLAAPDSPTAAGSTPPVEAGEPPVDELWGRVVAAETRAPIRGADVRLQHRDADEFWNLDLDYGTQIDELGRATSGADGRFRFEVARARSHRLQVYAQGFASTTVLDCTGGSEVVVALTPGAIVEGVVRCDGDAVAAAEVRIAVAGESVALATGETDREGRFRFVDLQPASVYVQVQSEQHPETWERLELVSGKVHRIEVELPAGASLTGRVIDAASRAPIANARISPSWTFKRSTRSGADGSFRLTGLGGGSVELYVRADDYAAASRAVTTLKDPVEFALVRGGEVTGKFVDTDGVPLASVYAAVGASFSIRPGHRHTDWIRASVAGSGLFRATGLRPEQHYWLYARDREHGTRVYALPRPLASNERIDLGDIVLHPAGGLEGRVIDDQGTPVATREVSIRGHNSDAEGLLEPGHQPSQVSQFAARSIRTDQRGRFRATGLAAGEYTVGIRAQQRSIAQTVVVVDGEVSSGIELTLPASTSIGGTLRYADGREIGDEGSQIRLSAWRNGGMPAHTAVEAGGRFRFSDLEEGTYNVSAFRCLRGWAVAPRSEVASGTEDLQLVLDAAATITGRVTDADGNGVRANLWARWKNYPGEAVAVHASAEDGTFRLEVAPDFVGVVGAMDPEMTFVQAQRADVRAGSTDLVLQLQTPAQRHNGRRKR